MEQWFDVALGNSGEDDFNTIALTGIDVVVPLERDADGDPLQDDEVRLRSEDGTYDETVRVDHPDVEETEGGLLLYKFRDVPPGLYRAWVCVGGAWTEVMRGLVVSKKGAFYMGKELAEAPPTTEIADAPPDEEPEEADEDENEYLEYVDGIDTE